MCGGAGDAALQRRHQLHRSSAEAAETARRCRDLGAGVELVQGDVTRDADCRWLAEVAVARWGRIDALIKNAGVTKFAPNHADLDALQGEDFHRIYDVNVVGAYQMIRAVAPAMRAQGAGAIVNVSSISALLGIGSSISYAASKGTLNTLTLSLARSLAPAIRANAVCPDFIDTRWHRGFGEHGFDRSKGEYESRMPLRKIISPRDVARAALWFIEGSDVVTGEFLVLDCGRLLGSVTTSLAARGVRSTSVWRSKTVIRQELCARGRILRLDAASEASEHSYESCKFSQERCLHTRRAALRTLRPVRDETARNRVLRRYLERLSHCYFLQCGALLASRFV